MNERNKKHIQLQWIFGFMRIYMTCNVSRQKHFINNAATKIWMHLNVTELFMRTPKEKNLMAQFEIYLEIVVAYAFSLSFPPVYLFFFLSLFCWTILCTLILWAMFCPIFTNKIGILSHLNVNNMCILYTYIFLDSQCMWM